MDFMQSYKKLDNLCRDINSVGVTGYIEDMERKIDGKYNVSGWDDDYRSLKRYRHIRNQIAHEPYASEENMCTYDDEKWVRVFYQRIMKQSDPLSQYRKATQPTQVPKKKAHPQNIQNSTRLPASTQANKNHRTQKSHFSGYVTALLIVIAVLIVLVVCGLFIK